jgi:hypothetical protein
MSSLTTNMASNLLSTTSKDNTLEVDILPRWLVIVTKLSNLLAQPTIDSTLVTPKIFLVCNKEVVIHFKQIRHGQTFCFQKVLLDCGAQLELLDQSSFVGLGMMDDDLEACPYQIQTLMGAFEKTYVFTKTNTSQPILWQILEKGVCLLA